MRILHISKGYRIDTTTGYQLVVARHGSTSFVVHNYDDEDHYTGASILTDREILHNEHDCTRKVYDLVELD